MIVDVLEKIFGTNPNGTAMRKMIRCCFVAPLVENQINQVTRSFGKKKAQQNIGAREPREGCLS